MPVGGTRGGQSVFSASQTTGTVDLPQEYTCKLGCLVAMATLPCNQWECLPPLLTWTVAASLSPPAAAA